MEEMCVQAEESESFADSRQSTGTALLSKAIKKTYILKLIDSLQFFFLENKY